MNETEMHDAATVNLVKWGFKGNIDSQSANSEHTGMRRSSELGCEDSSL